MELFLIPFKACSADDGTYLLDKAKIESDDCKFMVFEGADDEPQLSIDVKNSTEFIIKYLGFGETINFFGYIVVRKIIVGFNKCGE
jgi:hypothetical protein